MCPADYEKYGLRQVRIWTIGKYELFLPFFTHAHRPAARRQVGGWAWHLSRRFLNHHILIALVESYINEENYLQANSSRQVFIHWLAGTLADSTERGHCTAVRRLVAKSAGSKVRASEQPTCTFQHWPRPMTRPTTCVQQQPFEWHSRRGN